MGRDVCNMMSRTSKKDVRSLTSKMSGKCFGSDSKELYLLIKIEKIKISSSIIIKDM